SPCPPNISARGSASWVDSTRVQGVAGSASLILLHHSCHSPGGAPHTHPPPPTLTLTHTHTHTHTLTHTHTHTHTHAETEYPLCSHVRPSIFLSPSFRLSLFPHLSLSLRLSLTLSLL